jgi:predicted transglutaminase-like cysteine proteinase
MLDGKPLNDPAVIAAYKQLQAVNGEINGTIEYKSDIACYNRADFWEIAKAQGDCEDFALNKQRALLAQAWPMRDLRLAGVGNPGGAEDHCVLLVRLAGGDYVLDNTVDAVLPWQQSGYQFHRVQVPGQFMWLRV